MHKKFDRKFPTFASKYYVAVNVKDSKLSTAIGLNLIHKMCGDSTQIYGPVECNSYSFTLQACLLCTCV